MAQVNIAKVTQRTSTIAFKQFEVQTYQLRHSL